MIDQRFGSLYQKLCINPILHHFKKTHPTTITLLACAIGVLSLPLIVYEHSVLAVVFLCISGFLDTLDGSIARHRRLTSPQGAVLDIFCDRIVEFSVVLGLFLIDPFGRGLAAVLMLGSILLCVTTFLVVGVFTSNETQKSFYYSPGLIERAEAFIFFFLMILFPSCFFTMAMLFATLTIFTAFLRCWQFLRQTNAA